MQKFELTKECKIPGTDIVLEAGDVIKIVESGNPSAAEIAESLRGISEMIDKAILVCEKNGGEFLEVSNLTQTGDSELHLVFEADFSNATRSGIRKSEKELENMVSQKVLTESHRDGDFFHIHFKATVPYKN